LALVSWNELDCIAKLCWEARIRIGECENGCCETLKDLATAVREPDYEVTDAEKNFLDSFLLNYEPGVGRVYQSIEFWRTSVASEESSKTVSEEARRYESKVGRAGCYDHNVLFFGGGFPDEISVQIKCNELSVGGVRPCISYIWSNDDTDKKGQAWLCAADAFESPNIVFSRN